MPIAKRIDREAFSARHAEGLTDAQLQEAFDISSATVCYHRKALHLPPNKKNRNAAKGRIAPTHKVQHPTANRSENASAIRAHARSNGNGDAAVAMLRLSEAALDAIWHTLDIEGKARMIEMIASRAEG